MADDKTGSGETPRAGISNLRELLAELSENETHELELPPPIPLQPALRLPQAIAPDLGRRSLTDPGSRSSSRSPSTDTAFQRHSASAADFQQPTLSNNIQSSRHWWLHFVGGVLGSACLVIFGAFALGYFSLLPSPTKQAALSDQVIEMLATRDRGIVVSQLSSTSSDRVPATANSIAEKFSQSWEPEPQSSEVLPTTAQVAGVASITAPESVLNAGNSAPTQPALTLAQTVMPAQTPGSPAVRGITANEIRFGISAPFSGTNKELGHHMRVGIETAFNAVNVKGGINNRQLKLVSADDGYEPARTALTMKQLYDIDQVFGFIGNVGTPTAAVALPFSLERRMLFYSPFSGANLLRRDPPDRYVFNMRASYAEETEAAVRYLVKLRRLKPEQIAVFAQQDAFGDSGFAGVTKALRSLRGGADGSILRLNYKRNTLDIDEAVLRLNQNKPAIKAVVMIATYRAAAKFIGKVRESNAAVMFTNVSFVGSTALAEELMLMGPRFATGVIVTQVVPAVDGYSSVGLDYKAALAASFPGEAPDYVSFESYLSTKVLIEALRRAGPQPDTEKVVEALESLRDYDIGLGATLTFSPTEHQGLHKVWGTELDETGHYAPVELQ